jgi:hypothetical protein
MSSDFFGLSWHAGTGQRGDKGLDVMPTTEGPGLNKNLGLSHEEEG